MDILERANIPSPTMSLERSLTSVTIAHNDRRQLTAGEFESLM